MAEFNLKALITGVDKLSPTLDGIRKNAAQFRKTLTGSGLGSKISFGELFTGGALALPFIQGTRAAIDFESSMADVKKVVNFDTPQQFKEMGIDILNMSKRLPMAAKDIAAIVAAGGQSGIDKSQLAVFAEDAVKMGIAFDQGAEESGNMMAKWRTSFKIGQDAVVALADKINYLSNNGPATAQQISDIVTKIGPLGQVAGLASGQIAAMGATLAGVGVEQDVAATGIKNFMLTMTSGASATKQQAAAFKSLRLDARSMAKAMQDDAQGAITKILTAVSKVDKSKQAAVLQNLFGRESIAAIAPMLTNLDLLQKNFAAVGNAAEYTGSMQQEYDSRAATTANAIQLFQNKIVALKISIGNVLLPAVNSLLSAVGPVVDSIQSVTDANPWLVKGLLGAAVGFAILRGAVLATTIATKLFLAVSNLSPIGIAVRLIAVAAGALIANWRSVAPFFKNLWGGIKNMAMEGWEIFKKVFSFSPLGLIIQNWSPIVDWFKGMWDKIKPYVQPVIDGAKWLFGVDSSNASAQSTPRVMKNMPQTRASLASQGAGTQVNGGIEVRFSNAPEGMRVTETKTNQSGLTVTPSVGYRSLARTGR